jgi:hypothetical protein
MTVLRKRRCRFTWKQIRNTHAMARSFHAPQREHPPKVQHPKPERVTA